MLAKSLEEAIRGWGGYLSVQGGVVNDFGLREIKHLLGKSQLLLTGESIAHLKYNSAIIACWDRGNSVASIEFCLNV